MGEIKPIVISDEKIVDRSKEQEHIEREIASPEADLTILYAESGVGKSALTARVARSITNMQAIIATTRPENRGDNPTEGAYLTSIFNAFVRSMQIFKKKYSKCTFEYYLSRNKSIAIKRKALEKMFDGIDGTEVPKTLGLSISKYVLSRIFRLYEYNTVALLSLRDRDSMLIASDYIKYVLKTIPILLIIDNFQNIDAYSLQLLIDWVLLTQSHSYFILEYTVEDINHMSQLMDFVNYLKDYTIKIKLIGLPYLKADDALRAIELAQPQTMDIPSFQQVARKFYETKSKGSMRKLIDFSLQFNEKSPALDLYDPTFERIRSATSEAQYIMAIVILHGGQVTDDHLRGIIECSIDPIVFSLDDTLQSLESDNGLLEKRNNVHQIVHAQIEDAWNSHKRQLSKFELLAQRNCISYYEKILYSLFSSTERKEDSLLFLIVAYAKYIPEKLGNLIGQLDCIMIDRIQPERTWKYILLFLEHIKGSEQVYIEPLHKLVIFCFNHNLYKNCLYILEQLAKVPGQIDTDFYMVYKINCIEYLEYHNEAIKLCEQSLSNSNSDKSRYYYLLLLMGCYRSINQESGYISCVNQIHQIPDYKAYIEYGYFLRLSEIYMNRCDALPFVSESVKFFKEHQMLIQEIKSGITYSFLMAVAGDLKQAYHNLTRIEDTASELHLFGNVFELNKASMLLLQNLYGHEVENLLKKAELSTVSPFDRLLILTMQLINFTECHNTEMTTSLLSRIEVLLERETDKHLIALVSYDLYHFYHENGQTKQATKYKSIAKSTAQYNQTVSYLLEGKKNPLTPNLFHTTWCIGFTFFWNIDYIEDE